MAINYMDMNNTKNETDKSNRKLWGAFVFLLIVFSAMFCHSYFVFHQLQNQLQNTRKVYVYDLQETLRGLNVDGLNAEFEAKVNILNHEVITAQNKISSLKEANVQADFSDVYLNTLRTKRDTLIKEYNDTIQNITNQINETLVRLAKQHDTPTIFNKQSVAAITPDVVDLTVEIINTIQTNNVNLMLN